MKTTIPTEKAKFWRDTQLKNLELLWATYVTHAFTPHFHEGFAIGVIQASVETFSYRKKQYFSPPGSLVLINPGEMHTGEAAVEQGWTYRMLYPEASLLQQAASEVAGRRRDVPFFPAPVVYDNPMAQLVVKLHLALDDEATSILERESLLLWTLAQLIVRHADDSPAGRQAQAERTAVQAPAIFSIPTTPTTSAWKNWRPRSTSALFTCSASSSRKWGCLLTPT